MNRTGRILIVEDQRNVRRWLEKVLDEAGYQVRSVASGEEALGLIAIEAFDLALLDLKLKTAVNGIAVLKELRKRSPDTVAIVLTAHASLDTAVEALRYGAHDYLFKPSSAEELLDSIHRGLYERRAMWRRNLLDQLDNVTDRLDDIRATLEDQPQQPDSNSSPSPEPPHDRFLKRGTLVVDFMRHLVTLDGQLLDLSPTEFEVFAYLVEVAPRVVTPQELVAQVPGYSSEPWEAGQLARQYVYRLRQKIKDATGRSDIIKTARGVGYAISDELL
jgi:DNA-binding response OmpR family regulator